MDKPTALNGPGIITTTDGKKGGELLSIGVEKHQAAFSSGTWLTGTPLTYLAPW